MEPLIDAVSVPVVPCAEAGTVTVQDSVTDWWAATLAGTADCALADQPAGSASFELTPVSGKSPSLLNVAVAVNVDFGPTLAGALSVSVRAPTLLVTVNDLLSGRFSVAEESPT